VSNTRDAAGQAGSQARSTLRDQADQRSSQAGERIKDFAGDFHSTAEELRKQGKDQPADLIEQVAGRADRVGDYLEQSNGEKLISDVERFGRERPWAIAAAGFAIGLTASRLLKASSADRYDRSVRQTSTVPPHDYGYQRTPGRQTDGQSTTPGQVEREQALAAGGPPMPGSGS